MSGLVKASLGTKIILRATFKSCTTKHWWFVRKLGSRAADKVDDSLEVTLRLKL